MNLSNQTKCAAHNYKEQMGRVYADADFRAGAEWERRRDKWNYLPVPKPAFNMNVNAFTSKGRIVLSFIDASGEFDLHECDQFSDDNGNYEHIVAWQYFPEPPKPAK